MWIKGHGPEASKARPTRIAVSWVLVVLTFCAGSPLNSENPARKQQHSLSGHQLVVLLDVNANQRKVLPIEISLAEGVIQRLNQPEDVFWVITFGSQSPALLKSGVGADEGLAAIREVKVEQTSEDDLSAHLYEALNLALGQFAGDGRPKSLLVITEGNDARANAFEQTASQAQRLHVTCDVAMVADHTFYGPKAIQRYGFYLRELAGKTRGLYVEVGGRPQRVPVAVDRLAKRILAQDR